MFSLHGKTVAGLGPAHDGRPPSWSTYVSVADADATLGLARDNGARVLLEPLEIPGAGRMAAFSDAVGAALCLWEPGGHIGAELVNEPGALCWTELACRDTEVAEAFYAAVFGWETRTETAGGAPYTQWMAGDRVVGGMLAMGNEWPAEIPAHWMSYFAVEDTDAAAAKASEIGGKVLVPPTTAPVGRFCILADDQGAAFSVIRLSDPDS
jgi:predicted enzyme related to lactoylglutathione lyase